MADGPIPVAPIPEIAPHVLQTVMSQLACAFPGFSVTLVLRNDDPAGSDYIQTTDQEPSLPAAIIGRWVLSTVEMQGGMQ